MVASGVPFRHVTGVDVIRTDLLVRSPIFLVGLVKTLEDAHIKVVAARRSSEALPTVGLRGGGRGTGGRGDAGENHACRELHPANLPRLAPMRQWANLRCAPGASMRPFRC